MDLCTFISAYIIVWRLRGGFHLHYDWNLVLDIEACKSWTVVQYLLIEVKVKREVYAVLP
jgi:hypothetical protein